MDTVSSHIVDRIAHVKINRGDDRNALDIQALEELRDTARALADQAELIGVIISGEPVFSAGADLSGSDDAPLPASKLEFRHGLKLGPDMCRAWEEIEAYTIGAIEGYCIGAGAALAATLDYRIAGASSFFRLPEVPLGINMSWQTLPRLVAQIGPARAKEYAIFGRRVSAEQALSWGLCEQLVEDGQAINAAMKIADELRDLPPIPVRMTKQSVNAAANALVQISSFMDRDQYLLTAMTDDFQEAMSAFAEKRKPKFSGN